jgi:hypothetical protein
VLEDDEAEIKLLISDLLMSSVFCWEQVCYYRYLRFYPNGKFLYKVQVVPTVEV